MTLTTIIELYDINYIEDRIELIAECNEYNEIGERIQQFSRSPFIFISTMTEDQIKEEIRLGAYSIYFQ
jgi:hypothetical protein